MYVPETVKVDICGFCSSFYQDRRHDDFLLFGVCANFDSGRVMVKYGEQACNCFNDAIKSIIEKCYEVGVDV